MNDLISLLDPDFTARSGFGESLRQAQPARKRMRRGHLAIVVGQAVILGLGGCGTSPAQNLFGSFFPAWMLCTAVGVAGTVVLHQVLSALSVNQYLIAPPLTYLCLALVGTLLVWLLWFGH